MAENYDVNKSVEELILQFNFVKKEIHNLVEDFVSKTEKTLTAVKSKQPDVIEVKNTIDAIRKATKKSAKSFEEKIEDLLDEWKKEVKADFKNPKRYEG